MLFAVGAFASVVVPKISAAMSDTEIAEPADNTVSDVARIDSSDYAGSKNQLAPLAGVMFYRGHHYVDSELHLFLEDAESGEYFDLPDFTGYRKEGVDVVFYIANESSEYAYRVRNRDLLKLLP
ncbi:hypothetical protein ACJJIF_01335 [Microbulbifer sp. SSSA002]|uniref:hypothetical protein n=1 Tax=Microbulbifer sp. SSSA002 TaxID=3243376 RepID=UPI0040396D19